MPQLSFGSQTAAWLNFYSMLLTLPFMKVTFMSL
jgi:hypothetical protein